LIDELGSPSPHHSNREKGPKYKKHRKKLLNKDYEFKTTVKFKSLTHFKENITFVILRVTRTPYNILILSSAT
jgi:hypothetical protein